jgi:hypothetical protein
MSGAGEFLGHDAAGGTGADYDEIHFIAACKGSAPSLFPLFHEIGVVKTVGRCPGTLG